MTKDYSGVISELVAGQWRNPATGEGVSIDIRSIVIEKTLDGMEGRLVKSLHAGEKLGIVTDRFTHEVLGGRVTTALKSERMTAEEIVWQNPRSTDEGVQELRDLSRHCDGLIAVGSGTINDSVKYACFLDNKKFSVFPTSPQNAYTTPTASISFGGFKKSLACHPPLGVFFDLSVVSQCPIRLTRSAFADVICRTTAQVDWLMSHMLLGTAYRRLPYVLLSYDENSLIENAAQLRQGDIEAFGTLIRICALMGLGTNFAGTTHSGSMGEHMISHYIDMFAGDAHPGTLHGEQVGVATLSMSRLQNAILGRDAPPMIEATHIDIGKMVARYGKKIGVNCIEQFKRKALDHEGANRLNQQLTQDWKHITERLCKIMLPNERVWRAMEAVGAPKTARELGLPTEIYREAVLHAREIRDRFTMLDVAGDAGMLEAFAAACD